MQDRHLVRGSTLAALLLASYLVTGCGGSSSRIGEMKPPQLSCPSARAVARLFGVVVAGTELSPPDDSQLAGSPFLLLCGYSVHPEDAPPEERAIGGTSSIAVVAQTPEARRESGFQPELGGTPDVHWLDESFTLTVSERPEDLVLLASRNDITISVSVQPGTDGRLPPSLKDLQRLADLLASTIGASGLHGI